MDHMGFFCIIIIIDALCRTTDTERYTHGIGGVGVVEVVA